MNQLTSDLTVVAVYLNDIMISGTTAEGNLNNLRQLLKHVKKKDSDAALRNMFLQKTVLRTYHGHTISRNGISKGPKADAVTKMPAPSNVSQLHLFVVLVQFYNKFSCLICQPCPVRSII